MHTLRVWLGMYIVVGISPNFTWAGCLRFIRILLVLYCMLALINDNRKRNNSVTCCKEVSIPSAVWWVIDKTVSKVTQQNRLTCLQCNLWNKQYTNNTIIGRLLFESTQGQNFSLISTTHGEKSVPTDAMWWNLGTRNNPMKENQTLHNINHWYMYFYTSANKNIPESRNLPIIQRIIVSSSLGSFPLFFLSNSSSQ